MPVEPQLTPMLAQYQAIKAQYPNIILMFRLGDFYETFGEDAKVTAEALHLTLTGRPVSKDTRIPMCGVPYHAVDRYVRRLIALGHRVALCDQVEDPKTAKGLVRREVTRVVTPGTVLEDEMLDATRNNYLVVLAGAGEKYGLAAADVSTGEFVVTQIEGVAARRRLLDEITRLNPAECLIANAQDLADEVRALVAGRVDSLEADDASSHDPRSALLEHFGTTTLRGFGCEELPLAIEAAAGLIGYLRHTQAGALDHLRSLATYSLEEAMMLDAQTRRNLELVQPTGHGPNSRSLVQVLDRTVTAMGGRLLRRWLLSPLLEISAIHWRQDAVGPLFQDGIRRGGLRDALRRVADIERLTSRASTGSGTPRDLQALRASLEAMPDVHGALQSLDAAPLVELRDGLDALPDLLDLLRTAIVDDPPANLRDGGVIREGFDAELDSLRTLSSDGKGWIAALEAEERERTGIRSLKVGYNAVFGYFIEVSKANLGAVPQDYFRKQTTAGGERYVTPKLKEYEAGVLGAEERIGQLEASLFNTVRARVAGECERLFASARALAQMDVLAALAEVASAFGYVRPDILESAELHVTAGRHPVVEHSESERFVPNDVHLGTAEERLMVLTGPNMSGKSTFLRQTALIALLAQVGSFVPADSAQVGVIDRIFTRVGAQDDLASGQSTFMVEMTEAAAILNNATGRSLIILDEIGRGTSTFDGLAIAWATVEFLAHLGAKTLFATHYHQLNDLEKRLPGVRNYRVLVKEQGHHIVWLHKIAPGGTDKSYGIQVARLAGMPERVVLRAREVLKDLEANGKVARPGDVSEQTRRLQLTFLEPDRHPVIEAIKDVDVDTLTPLEALQFLADLKRKVVG